MDYSDQLKPSKINRQKRRDKRLHEEVIECGRYNGGRRNKKSREDGRRRVLQNQARRGGMPYRERICPVFKRTAFDDNLEPLTRFLQSNVGRKWDDVYSELSQKLDKSSVTGLHVFQHLWGFVDLHPLSPKRRWLTWAKFFVHPENGVLCDGKKAQLVNGAIVITSDHKGPFPKKARWKKQKEKDKWKRKLGIPVPSLVSENAPKPVEKKPPLIPGDILELKFWKWHKDENEGLKARFAAFHEGSLEMEVIAVPVPEGFEVGQRLVLKQDGAASFVCVQPLGGGSVSVMRK